MNTLKPGTREYDQQQQKQYKKAVGAAIKLASKIEAPKATHKITQATPSIPKM
jgi:hypothetical protein